MHTTSFVCSWLLRITRHSNHSMRSLLTLHVSPQNCLEHHDPAGLDASWRRNPSGTTLRKHVVFVQQSPWVFTVDPEGVAEPPTTSTRSLLLSISATLPSTSVASSSPDMPPMRLSCNDTWNPSKLEAPTSWPSMTCALSSKRCRSRIPHSDCNSARAVRPLNDPAFRL